MQHKHRSIREWLALFGLSVALFGLFFPKYTLTDEVCTVSMEECENEELLEEVSQQYRQRGVSYRDLRSGKVRVKSKVFEWISKLWR